MSLALAFNQAALEQASAEQNAREELTRKKENEAAAGVGYVYVLAVKHSDLDKTIRSNVIRQVMAWFPGVSREEMLRRYKRCDMGMIV